MNRLIQIHIFFLALLLADILLGIITGYTFKSGIILCICIGYYLSVIACFIRVKSLDRLLKEKTKTGTAYVVSLSAILFVELMAVCISALYIFIVVLFNFNAPVKADGMGYQIRSQASLMWSPRYVLLKNGVVVEKEMGSTYAAEEDFEIGGKITNVNIDSVVNVIVNDRGRDTVLRFSRH